MPPRRHRDRFGESQTRDNMRRKAKDVDLLVNRISKLRLADEDALLASHPGRDAGTGSTQREPFRFADLPYELRMRVYEFLLIFPKTIDLDTANYRAIAPSLRLFLVDRRMHEEASRVFYGRNVFRVFPVHGRYINRKHPLLAWLPIKYRTHITRLELRLGPGFTRPPTGWVVDQRLGLAAAKKIYKLKVFVEFDPASNDVFEQFRGTTDFYKDFCVTLLRGLLTQVPSITEVEFDAYPGVSKSSPLLQGLVTETKLHQKHIAWGPDRGWEKIVDRDLSLVMQNMGL